MDNGSITVGDLPREFMDDVGRGLGDYSVALFARVKDRKANGFSPIGSGVLVRRGSLFGILTAHHCLHKPGPEMRLGPSGSDMLYLALRGGRGVMVQPQDVIKHPLVTPQSEEFGPDLAFIEFPPGERLASLKAVGSFWSLDLPPSEIIEAFGLVGTPIVRIGFPGFHYHTRTDGNSAHHEIRHMAYFFSIAEGDVFEREGWDYVESTCYYGDSHELPPSFAGLSGGPVWGMQLRRDKAGGQFSLTRSALVGITFYQTGMNNRERRLRSHFIKSIYELAWGSLR